jgi:hypothetical protein
MGIAVAGQERLQAEKLGGAGAAEQDRTDATLQQADAPQDEGAHDQLAELRGTHDECTQPGRIERQRDAPVGTRARTRESRPLAQLMQLAGEMTAFERLQGDFLIEPVTAERLSRPLEQKPGWHATVADLVDLLSRREASRLDIGETLDDLELRFAQPRETLDTAIGDRHHRLDLFRCSHRHRSLRSTSVGSGGDRFNLDVEKVFAIPPRAWRPSTSTSSPTRFPSLPASERSTLHADVNVRGSARRGSDLGLSERDNRLADGRSQTSWLRSNSSTRLARSVRVRLTRSHRRRPSRGGTNHQPHG